jgi:carbon-monoxide dehydrogenase medium subunit
VIHGAGGDRVIGMDDFHRGPYETAVAFNEVLLEVRIPVRPLSSSAYEKVERRVGDWAVVAAGASVTLTQDGTVDDVAIGVTAVGLAGRVAGAEEALRGRQPTDDLIVEAGRLTGEAVDPISDQRGSVEYKRHLAGELTQRVLRRAIARAKGQEA